MLHFLRLRYLALILFIWFATTMVDMRWVIQAPIDQKIKMIFSALGYENATYEISEMTLSHFVLENINLDPDAINTIERIEANYSIWGLLNGQLEHAIIEKPDLLFSAESYPHFPDVHLDRGFSLSSLPIDELEINDLTLSYAGEEFNPSLNGKIIINKDENNLRRAMITLDGAQKDFSLNLKIALSERTDGLIKIDAELPEMRIEIPDVFMISRAYGKIKLDYKPGAPLTGEGKFMAGGMRVKQLPFDDISIVMTGKNPSLSVIGSATITGMPETNISLRANETEKNSQILLQISGQSPKALAKLLNISTPWPEQQKFSAAFELKDKSLINVFNSSQKGGLFFYLDQPSPVITASFSCKKTYQDCQIDVPTTLIPVTEINKIASGILAGPGITLNQGHLLIGGKILLKDEEITDIQYEIGLKNIAMNWQDMTMNDLAGSITGRNQDTLNIILSDGKTLGGHIKPTTINLKNQLKFGKGQIIMTDLNLDELQQLMKIKGLSLSGRGDIKIPFQLADSRLSFEKESSLTLKKGAIKYHPETYPDFLNEENPNLSALREVLKNFRFETANFTFEGNTNSQINGNLVTTGVNPDQYGNRPIELNLKTKGPLSTELTRLIQAMTVNN